MPPLATPPPLGGDPASSEPLAPEARLAVIEDEIATVCGQISSLMARLVTLAGGAVDTDLLGASGCTSPEQWLAWRTGYSSANAGQLVALARRSEELPQTIAAFEAGLLSVDQAGAIARRAPAHADGHYADIGQLMSVGQLRKAISVAVPPTPATPLDPEDDRQFRFGFDDAGAWSAHIKTTAAEGAAIETGLRAHMDALHHEQRRDREALAEAEAEADAIDARPPLPTWFDALDRMVDRSLEREANDRPRSQRTRVLVHLDAGTDIATLHLGPALSTSQRAALTCDASVATILERGGVAVSVGREHRITPERTRIVVEHRDGGCRIPSCGSTRKLVVHHIRHWANGGPTDTDNLCCLCPSHHRAVHSGHLAIVGDANEPDGLRITTARGNLVTGACKTRPPGGPVTQVAPAYRHPTGERMDWWSYVPPEPAPPKPG